jgi:hypothetical protein
MLRTGGTVTVGSGMLMSRRKGLDILMKGPENTWRAVIGSGRRKLKFSKYFVEICVIFVVFFCFLFRAINIIITIKIYKKEGVVINLKKRKNICIFLNDN